jgi:hypothetical protein
MNAPIRLGASGLLTESLFKTLVSCAVRKVQLRHDLTDQDLADKIACSAATIGNARNQSGKLQGHTLLNLLELDPLALEGLLNFYGRRSVPIEAKCDTDELVSTSGAVHKLAAVKSPTSHGGAQITDEECLEIEPEIDAAIEALCALKSRAESIRRKRA